jgi:hypothetical protein
MVFRPVFADVGSLSSMLLFVMLLKVLNMFKLTPLPRVFAKYLHLPSAM